MTATLKEADIRFSMDERGCWMDNISIKRLWRSPKHECVFLNTFETGSEARSGKSPNEVYATAEIMERLAALKRT